MYPRFMLILLIISKFSNKVLLILIPNLFISRNIFNEFYILFERSKKYVSNSSYIVMRKCNAESFHFHLSLCFKSLTMILLEF